VIGKEEDAKAGDGSSFQVCKTLTAHDEAICCVESSLDGTLLASSDMSGAILIHNPADGFEVVHRIAGDRYPATCMTFMAENWLVAGYLTGCLRLFSPENFHLHAEVAAHTRAITALDAHNEFAVSVGEDTFMNVWEISSSKPGAGPRVKLVSSQAVPNDMLTGVAFASTNSLFTAAYDSAHLKFWSPE
jgi:WD40 repeat protein